MHPTYQHLVVVGWVQQVTSVYSYTKPDHGLLVLPHHYLQARYTTHSALFQLMGGPKRPNRIFTQMLGVTGSFQQPLVVLFLHR